MPYSYPGKTSYEVASAERFFTKIFGENSSLATNGTDVALLSFPGLVSVANQVSIFQNTGNAIQANSTYTLTFDLMQFSTIALLNNATVRMYNTTGGATLASMSGNTLLSLLTDVDDLNTLSFSYSSGAVAPAGNIGIDFTIGDGVNATVLGSGLVIDNVRLDVVPVPEPGTAFLLGMAGWWMQCCLRRRPSVASAI